MTEPVGRRRFLQTAVLASAGLAACRVFRSSRGESGPSVAERLGHPRDARLIITNADDIGCTHSVNEASVKAFSAGGITSGSVMVPCHGLGEFCQWSRTRPDVDLGIHLVFVSERPASRWGPILPPDRVPSLVDADGYFPHAWSRDRKVNVEEVEAECRAQIERARHLGITPTHLDAHQHLLQFYGPELFAVLVKVAGDYRLPYRVARSWFKQHPYLRQAPGHNIPLDHRIEMRPGLASPAGWTRWYADQIRGLRPGLTEILVHPGYDDPELQRMTADDPNWGASWRQRDFDAMMSQEVRQAFRAVGAIPVTWRQVGTLLTF